MPSKTPIRSVNDFVVRFANVNGSGSASANELFARSVLRMGIPVAPRNIFPSNIQGLPTWYEVRISEAGHLGARGGVDLMVAMNPQTWDKDLASIEPGGYLFYDSTKPMPSSKFRADINDRPAPMVEIVSQKMGIHEWSYDNDIAPDRRYRVPLRDKVVALRDIKAEVELGYVVNLALKEAHRCLNCDVQTVFTSSLCIECDACVDICPMDCITFTANGEEADLRTRLKAPAKNVTQDLYVANDLKTGRVMVKDEDVCLHCGLCAERCPTGAWDMQKYLIEMTHAEQACRSRA